MPRNRRFYDVHADPDTQGQRDSRVLVFSQRGLHRPVWHAWEYEFEDLLLGLDDTTMVAPLRSGVWEPASRVGRRLSNAVVTRLGGRRTLLPDAYPGMARTRITSDHDLFFAVIDDPYQLSYLRRLDGWRERSTRAACLIVELWTPDVLTKSDYLETLSAFDDVYVFNSAALPALHEHGAGRASFMPVGVDALRASPLPHVPNRVLDCYAFGRTSPVLHQQLLGLAEDRGLTYLYDTMTGHSVQDFRAHRALLYNMMKRAQYFLAHRINDSPERRSRTGGDEGMSTRYFEGVAGGAVVLGSPSLGPDFGECFDWKDAVISLPYESSEVLATLADLAQQPERLAEARAANVQNSMLRHDWVYRWDRVLTDSGLPPTASMNERRQRLVTGATEATAERLGTAPAWGAR